MILLFTQMLIDVALCDSSELKGEKDNDNVLLLQQFFFIR